MTMQRPAEDQRPPGTRRLAIVDAARGAALCGMMAFHIDWDLAYWRWQDFGPADSAAWMSFGHAVAASFLFLSGLCLALARHRGPRAALRRIAMLASVALAITAVTWWLFPGEFIFFGIIHCIAVTNLLALALLRAPVHATLLAAGLAAILPSLLGSPGLDGPIGWSLGLARDGPVTLDYRPLLPWLSPVLLGVAAERLVVRLPDWYPRSKAAGALAWAGRHSLPLYIVHQPILFGLFFLLSALHSPSVADEPAAFSRQCRTACVATGAGRPGCEAACDCVLAHIGRRFNDAPRPAAPPTAELRDASRACLDE